jgi:hypothetical protein
VVQKKQFKTSKKVAEDEKRSINRFVVVASLLL